MSAVANQSQAGAPNAHQSTQELEEMINSINTLQNQLKDQIENRRLLEMQRQENQVVLEELKKLEKETIEKDSSSSEQIEPKVYKLTGPVLLPFSREEALQNVKKRLEFITGEIERVEKSLGDKQKEVCLLFFYFDSNFYFYFFLTFF